MSRPAGGRNLRQWQSIKEAMGGVDGMRQDGQNERHPAGMIGSGRSFNLKKIIGIPPIANGTGIGSNHVIHSMWLIPSNKYCPCSMEN